MINSRRIRFPINRLHFAFQIFSARFVLDAAVQIDDSGDPIDIVGD